MLVIILLFDILSEIESWSFYINIAAIVSESTEFGFNVYKVLYIEKL